MLIVVSETPAAEATTGTAAKEKADIEALGEALCSEAEVVDLLELPPDTLDRPSRRSAFNKGRRRGLAALRRAQLKLAETNASVAIFLGRVYLGQAERREGDPRESNEIAEVAQNVRDRLRALVVEANRNRGPYPGGDRRDE